MSTETNTSTAAPAANATKDQLTAALKAASDIHDSIIAFENSLTAPDLKFLAPVAQGAADRIREAGRYLNDKIAKAS
jgi:hypothetical protein